MNRSKPLSISLACALVWIGASRARSDEFKLNDRTFTLPAGFTIEKVAGPPLVDRPITADFDEKGRLYVSDSSGSNDKVAKQLEEKPHKIVRLEDTNGDGVFDRKTIFADKMMFPEGTMWHDGSLYVSAPPSIWKLTDTNDDGVADERVEWHKGKTLTTCANDLHGPYRGLDGWIYWTKGAFATQTYDRPGKPPFVTRAAHIFRARPDGTGLEAVMTGGMDNPVDVAFTPGGERIFTTTFLQRPGQGNRDGLLHAVYGGIYGQVNDAVDGHPRTGPDLMPVLVHLGAAAPSGLVSFESQGFGDNSVGTLFACNFNMRRITRHRLQPKGATFEATTDEFLVSPDLDFHPTDIVEDADGSMLVIDTGGWYKLCCPTSQIPKPDVLGAIYRVRYADKPAVENARGGNLATLTPSELAALLGDERPYVQKRAIEALAKRGIDACPALENVIHFHASNLPKRNAIWAATRIDEPEARLIAQSALADTDPTVRQAALHSISLWRDATAVAALLKILEVDKDQIEDLLRRHAQDPHLDDLIAQNRRAAAEALGRIGDKSAAPALLAAVGQETTARVLEHSCTYALIEIADAKAMTDALHSTNLKTQRAALVALDQMTDGGLKPDQVVPFLTSTDFVTRETASWIAGRHPEWAASLAGFLRDRINTPTLTEAEQSQLVDQLAKFAREAHVQDLLGKAVAEASAPPTTVRVALRAMAKSGLKVTPDAWKEGITAVLRRDDPAIVAEAVACARALPIAKESSGVRGMTSGLLVWGSRTNTSDALRLDALSAIPEGLSQVSPEIFAFLRDRLDPSLPVGTRLAAASVLSRAALDRDQLFALTESVKTAGPLEVDRVLAAFERSQDESVGLALVASLKASKAGASLRAETLKPRLDKFGQRVRSEAEAFYATLNVDAPAQKARLESLLPALARGDMIRGQTVFNGPKAGCLSCHAVGYLGGKVGPDLTRIAQIRTDRDLLESILYPSLSFVRSYEPVTIETKDGKVVNGVIKGDTSDEVVLAINASDLTRVPRSEIEEMRPGTVSVMPAGLDQQLTTQELADLLAFLRSRK